MKKNILIVILFILLAIVCAILAFQYMNIGNDGETSEPEPPAISSQPPQAPPPSSSSQAQNEPPVQVPPADPSSSSQAVNRPNDQDAPEQPAAPYNSERAETLPPEVDEWIRNLPTDEDE